MSQEIVNFIESFKEFDKNFARYEYESDKYECEIAQIARIQRAANENLKAFWDKQVQNDYFELKHPLYNHIQTRAVANFYNCITNIVFMIDEDNKHPWLLIQVTHACNAFFTPYKAFCVLETWNNLFSGIIGGVQKFITHFNVANASYRDIKFGFLLSNVRPMHYFLNNLADIVTFHLVKKVCPRASFFVPKFLEVNKGEPMVYVYVADGYRHSSQVYNYVADESLQDKKNLIPPDPLKSTYDLTLWLGLPGERRAWLEQIEGTAQILKNLSKYFKKIKVYIDGMTAYDGQRQDFPENKALFNKVVLATKEVFDKECKDKEFKDLETQSASKENLTSSDLKTTQESLNLTAGGGGGI